MLGSRVQGVFRKKPGRQPGRSKSERKKKDSFFLQVCPGHGRVTPRLELSGLNSFGLNSRRPGKGLEQKMSECVPPRRNLPAPKEEGSNRESPRPAFSFGVFGPGPPPRNPSSPPTPVHPQERKGKGGGLPRKKGGDPVHRKSFSVSAKRH